MLSLYTIFSERSCKWLIFLFNTLPWTSKLVDNSQTELQWRISLGLSFVLDSYILTTLLKQTISYQPFYINLKQVPNDNVLSIPTPNSFYLLDSQILSSPIFAQILSCLYPPTSKWHLSSFSFISLFWNHSIAKKLSCSNLFMRDPRYLSQAKKSFFKKMKLRTYWRLPAKVFQ